MSHHNAPPEPTVPPGDCYFERAAKNFVLCARPSESYVIELHLKPVWAGADRM